MNRHLSNSALFFIILALLTICYFPQLMNSELLGDDIWRIAELSGLTFSQVLSTELADRPLLITSIWFEHNILQLPFGALRFVNILLLSLISVFIRKLAVVMLELQGDKTKEWVLCTVAILFALHPLHTQTVGHIVQRGILIAGLGSVLATYFLIKSKFEIKSRYWCYAIVLWGLALLSKPNVIFFLGFWVILIVSFYEKNKLKSLIPFFLAILIPICFYKIGGFNSQQAEGAISPFDYFLIQGKVIPLYFKLIIYPVGLKFNHDIVINPQSPFYLGLIFWFLLVTLNLLILYLVKNRLLKLALLSISLSFLPESSFFPIIHTIFEHRTFFPILFIALSMMLIHWPTKLFIKWIASVLISSFAVLIFSRSYDVRNFRSWAREEVSHTCNLSYLSFYIAGQFFLRNDINSVNYTLESLRKCPNLNTTLIQSIVSLKSLYSKEVITYKDLSEIKSIIHSDNLMTPPIRNVFNNVIQNKLLSLSDKSLSPCLIEDFGSVQLKVARQNPRSYKSLIQSYKKASSDCLATRLPQEKEYYRELRIRAIRVAYFGEQDSSLKSEIESKGSDVRLEELLALIENGPYFK
ncbi:MAG: hypothetical protein ACLGG0_07220 [Bacteriovoracia bacterium]